MLPEYLTQLPSKELLFEKLKSVIKLARDNRIRMQFKNGNSLIEPSTLAAFKNRASENYTNRHLHQ